MIREWSPKRKYSKGLILSLKLIIIFAANRHSFLSSNLNPEICLMFNIYETIYPAIP